MAPTTTATTDPLGGELPVKAGAATPTTAANAAGGPTLAVSAPSGGSTQSTITGLNSAQENLPLWVPVNLGEHGAANITPMTVGTFVAMVLSADQGTQANWIQYLIGAGAFDSIPGVANGTRAPTPAELTAALTTVAKNAAVGPGENLDTYLTNSIAARSAASTANGGTQLTGSARFFKGTTTEIPLTTKEAVQSVADAAAQQLLGRHATADEVNAITGRLNTAEMGEGTVRAQAAQAQQAGLYEAYTGGSEAGAPGGAGGPAVTVGMAGTGNGALAALPGWQASVLQQLASQNKLYGVDPNVLGAIIMAESSGKGGAINSAGYGGFFGLSASSDYPGGKSSSSLLQGTDQAAFSTQAQLAASEFASLLKSTGGNVWLAETAYQQGGNSAAVKAGTPQGEGVDTMKKYGIPEQAAPGGNVTAASQVPGAIGPPNLDSGTIATGTPQAPAGSGAPAQATQAPVGGPPLPAGGVPAPGTYTMGQATSFQTPTGTDYVEPAQAAVVNAPPTPGEEAAAYMMNNESKLYQTENLTNVFAAINKMLSANTGGAKAAPTPLDLAAR